MAANHKLTSILKGRITAGTVQQQNILEISFDDGSTIKVKTLSDNTHSDACGQKILKVREEDAELDFGLRKWQHNSHCGF